MSVNVPRISGYGIFVARFQDSEIIHTKEGMMSALKFAIVSVLIMFFFLVFVNRAQSAPTDSGLP